MNLKKLMPQAKRLMDQRGGSAGLQRDAKAVQEAMKGGGTSGDKAKRALGALKRPGGRRDRDYRP